MAMNYKPSMTKAELLEIAAENGVQADDGMTKTAILAALDGANSRAPDGAEPNTSPPQTANRPHRAAQDRPGTEREPRTPPGRKRPQRTRRKPRRGTTCLSMPGRPSPAGD